MERIAIIDSHHHLWDLDSKETHYPWLSSNEEEAFYGSFKSIKKSYLLYQIFHQQQHLLRLNFCICTHLFQQQDYQL